MCIVTYFRLKNNKNRIKNENSHIKRYCTLQISSVYPDSTKILTYERKDDIWGTVLKFLILLLCVL